MKSLKILLLSLTFFTTGCSMITSSSQETPPAVEVVQNTAELPGTPVIDPTPLPQLQETPVIAQTTEIPGEVVVDVTAFPDPAGFTWKVVVSGMSQPVDMADTGDGRMLIVEQGGRIRLLLDGTLQPDPFLDIRDRVGSSGNEQGLLGLALDPEFLVNGRFYVNYTDKNGDTVVSRFFSLPDALIADPAGEVRMISVAQPYANHNGGGLAFGPDGYLYIGLGDGGSGGDPQGNGQSLETYLGKLLRVDVNVEEAPYYGIPADNPFVGSEFAATWAYGLRNPWRFSFDRLTGDLYIADVGQNKWEEVNFLAWSYSGGVNFGWNYREGAHVYEGTSPAGLALVDPIWEYGHDLGCSVTGGFVYRGELLPEWQGIYIVGDYCNGRIWGLLQMPDNTWQSQVLFDGLNARIGSFGQDSFGELYLLSLNSGEVLRLERR